MTCTSIPVADRALKPIGLGLMLVVGLVLVIACANVASMLLARASGRQKEIGIRLAIGASRRRLIQQLLSESIVMASIGAAAGVAVAWAMTRLAMSISLPIPIPLSFALRIDGRVLLFTAGVTMLAALVAGLAPALKATRPNLVNELKSDVSATQAGGRRWTLRDGLVVTQIAVTMVLLVAAGLLTRSLMAAQHVDIGFRTGGLAIVSTEMGMLGYDDGRAHEFYDRAIERVRAIPGVESAALAVRLPFSINYNRNSIFLPDRQGPDDKGLVIDVARVSPEYFPTLGIPIVQGRNFASIDTPASPGVAIVNEAMARKYWPNQDAIGKRFRVTTFNGRELEVVGVSADYKVSTVGEGATPYIHYAMAQRRGNGEAIIARTRGDAGALLAAMRRESDGARAEHPLPRQPDDGCAGRGDAVAGEGGRHQRQRGGRRRDGARVDRPVWRHRLLRRAPHARDRHPHGARREAVGGRGAGDDAGARAGRRRHRHRCGAGARRREGGRGCALRRQLRRSDRLERRDRHADRRLGAGESDARPPRVRGRSVERAEVRVELTLRGASRLTLQGAGR